jgi:hypothetical protein
LKMLQFFRLGRVPDLFVPRHAMPVFSDPGVTFPAAGG